MHMTELVIRCSCSVMLWLTGPLTAATAQITSLWRAAYQRGCLHLLSHFSIPTLPQLSAPFKLTGHEAGLAQPEQEALG